MYNTSSGALTKPCATGRTTFVNTLCGKRVLSAKEADDAANAHLEEGVRIKPVTVGMCACSHGKRSLVDASQNLN